MMSRDPLSFHLLGGVISYEELPTKHETDKPIIYLVNTDPLGEPGEHWVAIYLEEKTAEFFDSLGAPPETYSSHIKDFLIVNGPQYKYSVKRIQGEQPVCGQYCILYAYLRARNVSIGEIVGIFGDNLELNDTKVSFI